MFVQVVGEGQEYRGRIFPRSICFVMATVFVVLHLWSTSSLCVMQFWKEIHSEFTVKALKGQNSAFLQVKFIEFLSVNVNASRVCDIRYKINDFIAFLLLFKIRHRMVMPRRLQLQRLYLNFVGLFQEKCLLNGDDNYKGYRYM